MHRFAHKLLRIVYPFGLFFYKVLGLNQDKFKSYFINVNNKITLSGIKDKKIVLEKIFFILPHCLQNSDCDIRVTGNKINNCKGCGKCVICEIKKIKEEFSLNIEIATGGNAARARIKELSPSLIFAIACENDLASGIFDISKIPVIGLLNSRPNGPCKDTIIDFAVFRDFIENMLKKEKA